MDQSNGLRRRLAPHNRVREIEVSLQYQTGSVYGTLDKDAVRHAGIDTEDPGSVKSYYLPDMKVLVFDLGGEFDERSR